MGWLGLFQLGLSWAELREGSVQGKGRMLFVHCGLSQVDPHLKPLQKNPGEARAVILTGRGKVVLKIWFMWGSWMKILKLPSLWNPNPLHLCCWKQGDVCETHLLVTHFCFPAIPQASTLWFIDSPNPAGPSITPGPKIFGAKKRLIPNCILC